jgi:hypothetical protein
VLKLLYWVLWPIASLGLAAQRLRVWADNTDCLRRAVKPGTQVFLNCGCHNHEAWYVDRYSLEADDYRLVDRWPYDWKDSDARSMFVKRDRFDLCPPGGKSVDDVIEEILG